MIVAYVNIYIIYIYIYVNIYLLYIILNFIFQKFELHLKACLKNLGIY